ncbi:MAG: flagellar biosynthesis anti-sigma factor FlgM [Proteobacteria bacterium]|nr:flagellar biosynthesis anti-sigma factor FlgM [Pseudomonadota bacterium]
MKINGNKPYDGVEVTLSTTTKVGNVKNDQAKSAGVKKQSEDVIEISKDSKKIAELANAIKNMPEIRAQKVEELKKVIESGNYTVDPRKLAEKIISEL